MRRAWTSEPHDNSVNSQTKRRMSKKETKRYKMDKLRLKFKTVAKQIRELRNDNAEDYYQLNQLMVSNQRLAKLTFESLEKTKRIYTESIELKRNDIQEEKIMPKFEEFTLQTHWNTQEAEEVIVLRSKNDQRQEESLMVSIQCLQPTNLNTLSNSRTQSIKVQNIKIGQNLHQTQLPSLIKDPFIEQPSFNNKTSNNAITKRLKEQPRPRLNRFQLQLRSQISHKINTKPLQNLHSNKKPKEKGLKYTQSMFPYISGLLFSILLLFAISN